MSISDEKVFIRLNNIRNLGIRQMEKLKLSIIGSDICDENPSAIT